MLKASVEDGVKSIVATPHMFSQLSKIKEMTRYARSLGLIVNAGHGLKYHNTRPIARIPGMEELNIGHSIISRSVFVGLESAVKEMVKIIKG